jgi:hypothetical protein
LDVASPGDFSRLIRLSIWSIFKLTHYRELNSEQKENKCFTRPPSRGMFLIRSLPAPEENNGPLPLELHVLRELDQPPVWVMLQPGCP